ncbi:Rpn family recombination-promoting nuclease/putative transposase [Mycoavidus sp. B2-EB]|uniref:Rpn family recombination-promoting nuclease/putative transposase n=1 Tax=Mycoavidus sp. B2-EB TaxID=2651972 RepID=UPI00162949D7|nr:Rpn family recombination-promoting nuclease/putative transposase [Mycoavidus sp. B2-EB]BBO60304.1 hypothetical protein MPB2EB_1444 [Mycoavidus sp. B2-EB]
MDDHLKAGHDSLPLVLPVCLYHGITSPYPYSTDIFDNFDDVEMAKALVFKPFQLIDLTTQPVNTLQQHGAAALMELLFKHFRNDDFIGTIRELVGLGLFNITLSCTTDSYLTTTIEYINSNEQTGRPGAAEKLLKLYYAAVPEKREIIMNFNEKLRQEGLQEGEHLKALAIAKEMLAEGLEYSVVKKVTGLSDEDIKKITPQVIQYMNVGFIKQNPF